MRIISVDNITGNEVLARDIVMGKDLLLVSKGTRMKREYIEKLHELEIEHIYIDDMIGKDISIENEMEYKIKQSYQASVKDIIKKFTSHTDEKLISIVNIAESVISEVLDNKDVLYSVAYVREKCESQYDHALTVCTLSLLLGIKLKMDRKRLRDLAIGALLHDIGMAFVYNDYKNMRASDRIPDDMKETKKHIIFGYTVIENIDYISNAAKDIILQHHERVDGQGYPFRLVGDKIRLESKIVAVCDVFDCLINSEYFDKLKVHDAIDYIVSRSSIKYDYHVVKAFNETVAAYPTGTYVITSEDEMGIVIRQNDKCPNSPVIRMIKDADGNIYHDTKIVDLTKELTVYVKDTISRELSNY